MKTLNITGIDRNFQAAAIDGLDVVFHNALRPPFVTEGFPWRRPDAPLYRLPGTFGTAQINQGALELAHHTAGGAVRFRTDSPHLALRAVLVRHSDMDHMPRTGSAGFDLYRRQDGRFIFTAIARPGDGRSRLEMPLLRDGAGETAEYLLNLPLYSGVESLEIGVAPGSAILPPPPHRIAGPIVFYGSSITQGGCASRPGNCYANLLCRALDAEGVNLGFAGSGKGEIALAGEIARLNPAAVVLDYDHNAPDEPYLAATHQPFFRAIRSERPEVPVLIVSRCNFRGTASDIRRREIIRTTYEQARAAGDRQVRFLDGELLFGTADRDACTVDGCHPNDLGFYRMYRVMLPILTAML